MNQEIPLTCNIGMFTSEQREDHARITTKLMKALQSIRELPNGYEFMFSNESQLITGLGEFIANERLCCPFLEFGLNVRSTDTSVSLSLTGPDGTQEFLRAEFEEVFQ